MEPYKYRKLEGMIRPEKIYDYQMQLINRRWQYFATYLVIIGLIANAIPKEVWQPLINVDKSAVTRSLILISLSGIVLGIVFTQLVSKSTERIDKIEIFIGKEFSITNLPLEGKFIGFFSETVVLYFAIYFFSGVWVYVLFQYSLSFFIISCIVLVTNLFFLKWKSLKHPDIEYESE
jgi:hypothetical protein